MESFLCGVHCQKLRGALRHCATLIGNDRRSRITLNFLCFYTYELANIQLAPIFDTCYSPCDCTRNAATVAVMMVHPQYVRFQNVRFQNVWNVRFTKRQVYKMSGIQNVRFTKFHINILYLWLLEIRRFCCIHVCRQSDGCVLFSILEGCFAIIASNK